MSPRLEDVTIITGDCLDVLRTMKDGSVDCCVTSPPYYGLRDYGVSGQIGLEESVSEYVEKMVSVFREVRRVLNPMGTLWLNLGDSYAGSSAPGCGDPTIGTRNLGGKKYRTKKLTDGLKRKDLIGIPWRVAFALQEDGWYLRQDIIWSKPNPMPESVTDRCTKSHEYLFLLSQGPQYHYNAAMIHESISPASVKRLAQKNLASQKGSVRAHAGGANRPMKALCPRYENGRNKRSVWTVSTEPFTGAHFATFPKKLIEPCILAGCPTGGVVLDPFAGAGTTGVVAQYCGRMAILIELNPAYVEIIKQRTQQAFLSL